jgi:arabinan endo-1,5-alpha-L-arabinosidase
LVSWSRIEARAARDQDVFDLTDPEGRTVGWGSRRRFIGSTLGTLASLAIAEVPPNPRMSGEFAPVHDPSIVREGEWYYVFSTNVGRETGGYIPCRRSRDLVTWEKCGFVFDAIPAWARAAVPGARGIWAPDISRVGDRFFLYYSVSTFGSNQSVIGLATNATLDPAAPGFEWRDQGLVVRSRPQDRFNAIDPNLAADRDGGYWLAWGSFWDGIKMARIDPATGKRPEGDAALHSLAWRPVAPGAASAIEAPFVISRGEWYYLFVSFDRCCRGVDSTYYVVCGRARRITGPYVDADGRALMEGGGSPVIRGDDRFHGTGHCAVLRDGDRDWLVYHAYDARNAGTPTLRISPLDWSQAGWPHARL